MADSKQDKSKQGKDTSSEGFGFKQSPLGFDKNEVNLYINKLKKQMKEQQLEFETRLSNLQINLEAAQKETNEAKNAKRAAEQAAATASAPVIQDSSDETKKVIEDLKAESDKKIMELRKLVLDERRNVAKLDKDCATAQMSEKKLRAEFEKLKEKYRNAKKSAAGGKAVTTTNADEIIDEAGAYAKEIIEAAKKFSLETTEAVNKYKAEVEKQIKERTDKLTDAKKKLEERVKKAEEEKAAAQAQTKEIAEKFAALVGVFDSFAGQFDNVNSQIEKVTSQIESVTGRFGSITSAVSDAAKQIGSVTGKFGEITSVVNDAAKQIDSVSGKFGELTSVVSDAAKQIDSASAEIDQFGKSLDDAKADMSGITAAVDSAKNEIGGGRSSIEEASALAGKGGASVDLTGIAAIGSEIEAAASAITAELKLPTLDESKFSDARLEEIKKKLKVETTYEGAEGTDEEEDEFEDTDIISSIQIDSEPAPVPSDDDLMADTPDVITAPVLEAAAPKAEENKTEEMKPKEEKNAPEAKAEQKKPASKADEDKPEMDSSFEDFFITTPKNDGEDDMSSAIPLINSEGVGAIDDFSLDTAPEPVGGDFEIAPNDLTAAPDKGADLGEDIFDMAINPVGADDDTLSKMMSEAEAAEKAADFELTPSNIDMNSKGEDKPDMSSDFGEFADLFAAGSAETTAPAPKKEKPPFRQPASNSGDDLWSFGSDGKSDDSDLSSDSDLSDLLL